MLNLEVWILIATVIGFVPLYADLVIRWRERHRLNFHLLRFFDYLGDKWLLRIYKPDKPITRCSVELDNVGLSWTDKGEGHYEKFIDAMGGGNVEIPKGTEKKNSKIIVRDGKKTIWKMMFQDVPEVDELKLTTDELNALGVQNFEARVK
jgi:hypothetical protein